jgi:hypothetical protein
MIGTIFAKDNTWLAKDIMLIFWRFEERGVQGVESPGWRLPGKMKSARRSVPTADAAPNCHHSP